MPKRIGLLTGGGDVPGLNSAIKSIVWRMDEAGWEVVGLRRGWAALINIIPDAAADNSKWIMPLNRASTRTIDRTGGTILHSSRINPEIVRADAVPRHLRDAYVKPSADGTIDLTDAAVRTFDFLELDALVAIGGDGTLTFAKRLDEEKVPVIAIPKTMDNDVYGTDYCIGFSTAVTRSVRFINDLRTAAGSHERFLIVELFGRYSGETCLLTSYLASTDRALLAEVPYDPGRLLELLSADKRANPSNYAVLAVSEGAYPSGGQPVVSGEPDDHGHRKLGGIGLLLEEFLENQSGEKVIYQQLGYLMRSGTPDSLDQLVANNFGNQAANLALSNETGKLVAILGGRYTAVPVSVVGEGIKRVDVDRFYDSKRYRPRIENVTGLPMFLH